MIVDCHTHWGRCYTERDGLDPSRWLSVARVHGVTHAVVLPEASLINAGLVREDNDRVASVCARSGGAMIPFCTVNFWDQSEAVKEARRCLLDGPFRGVKSHPWTQACSTGLPAMDDVCEIAAEVGAPILFHDGTPPFSMPSQIALLARRHPRATVVLGHAGLFEYWREAIVSMRFASNLWACLCGPYVAGIRAIWEQADRTRLVWGSDFGYGLADPIGYRLPLLREAGLNDAQIDCVLAENAARLLRL